MTDNDSRGTPANPSKDSPAHRGRDARKGAHDDSTESTDNKPPNHGKNTHRSTPGAYLEAAPPDTPFEEIGRAWSRGDDPNELWGDSE